MLLIIMKIAIIGAGWFGCHIANKLKQSHQVSIFDGHGIFSKASMNNQNRSIPNHITIIVQSYQNQNTISYNLDRIVMKFI